MKVSLLETMGQYQTRGVVEASPQELNPAQMVELLGSVMEASGKGPSVSSQEVWGPPKPEFMAAEARSPHWRSVRQEHIEKFPDCAVCGDDADVQVHHIKPFHIHPELELDLSNLITLCEKSSILGCNCHLVFGHFGNWHSYNPNVIRDAALLIPQIRLQRHKK